MVKLVENKKGKKKIVQSSKVIRKSVTEEGIVKNNLHLFLLGCVVLITFVIYTPALHNQFTNWDDGVYITNNPYITSLSSTNLEYIFSHPIAANYHPLTIISLAINYKFSGLSPFSYYFVNILFHLFNILLVYWLVLIISFRNKSMALFVAAIFAIHPMHVESVAWIAERKDVLYSFFFLSGLISYFYYLDKKGLTFYFLCFFLFLLSALSKPTAVVFPIILFIIDYVRQRKINLVLFAEKIPFFAIAFWIGLQTIHSQTDMVTSDLGNYNVLQKLLFTSYGFCMYIVKLIVPMGLSAFYPFPIIGQNHDLPVFFWLTPLINVAFIAAVIYSLKYTRIIAFGVLFYFITVALTLQFVQVGHAIIADRYTYLSYIGLLIGLYWVVERVLNNRHVFSIKTSFLVFLLFFIINVVIAFQRIPIWSTSETLWSDVIEKFPNTDIAYNGRGLFYYDKKQYPQTIADYSKAIELNPKYFEAYYNRGAVYVMTEKPRQAVADFSHAIALNPNYSLSFRHRADSYYALGKLDSAILDYNNAIRINPDLPEPLLNRGKLFMETGKFDEAILDFKTAIERSGNDPKYWFTLGVVYGKMGNFAESVNSLSKALEFQPDYYEALTNRAMAYASLNKGKEALNDLANAIKINPENPLAYFTRALFFLNNGKKSLACGDLQKARELGNSEANAIYQKECEK